MKTEVLKYLIAGGLAFFCDLSVLYLSTEYLGVHYLISNIFGYFVGLIVSYLLNIHWVFTYRRYKHSPMEFIIFTAIVFTGLGISEGLMALLVEEFGTHYLGAKFFVGFVVMAFNYTTKKMLLFHSYSPEYKHEL